MDTGDDIETMLAAAWRARRMSRPARALALFDEADRLGRASGDNYGLARALNGKAQIHRDAGRHAEALAHYKTSLVVCRSMNKPLLLAHTLRHCAETLAGAGDTPGAAGLYQQALDLYRQHGSPDDIALANALRPTALLMETMDRQDDALRLWEQALDIYATNGIESGVQESRLAVARCRGRIDR